MTTSSTLIVRTYAMVHIPASILFFAYAFKCFPAPSFQAVRRTLVCCNLIAFIVFSSWPCMPPRLLPAEYGYEDTLHKGKAASIWTTNKVSRVFHSLCASRCR